LGGFFYLGGTLTRRNTFRNESIYKYVVLFLSNDERIKLGAKLVAGAL
jgi:hypothetical protein